MMGFVWFVAPQGTTLEDQLRHRMANVSFTSPDFGKALHSVLDKAGATIEWQRSLGPTPIRIGVMRSDAPMAAMSVAFWPSARGTAVEAMDRISDNSLNGNVFVDGEVYRTGDRMVRCGDGWTGGNWTSPYAAIYRLRDGWWATVAIKGSEHVLASLPGTHFLKVSGKVDPGTIVATTNVYPEHLNQPHAGPLLRVDQTWKVRGDRIAKVGRRLLPTPLAELDRLAALAQAGDRPAFDRVVPAGSRETLWRLTSQPFNVTCPNSEEYSECDTLSVWSSPRKAFDGLTMHFAKVAGRWRLVKVVKPPKA